MSKFARLFAAGAAAAAFIGGSAAAQLLPSLPLPPLNLPTGNVPVAGPLVDVLLDSRQAREAVSPTLDSVSGLPERIAEAGAPTLLELRRLRLRELIREHPKQLEQDGDGLPVRKGVLVAIDPDPRSLQLATRAG